MAQSAFTTSIYKFTVFKFISPSLKEALCKPTMNKEICSLCSLPQLCATPYINIVKLTRSEDKKCMHMHQKYIDYYMHMHNLFFYNLIYYLLSLIKFSLMYLNLLHYFNSNSTKNMRDVNFKSGINPTIL